MNKTIGRYFVGLGQVSAQRVYFSWDEARKGNHAYIAVFDCDGEIISEWKLEEDGSYSTDF